MTGTSVTFRASRIGKRNAAMEIKEISNDKKIPVSAFAGG